MGCMGREVVLNKTVLHFSQVRGEGESSTSETPFLLDLFLGMVKNPQMHRTKEPTCYKIVQSAANILMTVEIILTHW